MKIGFFTPYYKEARGNSTTARRIITGLKKQGFEVEFFAYEEEQWDEYALKRLSTCSVFHILHFYRFTRWSKANQYELDKPYILTSGGTDINHNLSNDDQADEMVELLYRANAITVFTEDGKRRISQKFPDLERNVSVIQQAIWLPDKKVYSEINLPEGNPKVLLPAGLRAVKDVLYLFQALNLLRDHYPMLKFLIVGAPLEQTVLKDVLELSKENDWFHYMGGVQLEEMHQLYDWADIILNTSVSEGQSIAILEAMKIGKPVFARKNAGNESLVQDDFTGFLFDQPAEFYSKVKIALENPALRKKVALHGQKMVQENFSLYKESSSYINIYNNVLKEK